MCYGPVLSLFLPPFISSFLFFASCPPVLLLSPQKPESDATPHLSRRDLKKKKKLFPDDIQLAGCPSSHLLRSFLFVWPYRGQRKRSIFIRPHFLSFSLSPSARQKKHPALVSQVPLFLLFCPSIISYHLYVVFSSPPFLNI